MLLATQHYSENYSILMALVDYIPVVLFLLSGIIIIKLFMPKMNTMYSVLLSSGVVMVTLAGLLKAVWKTVIVLVKVDWEPLNVMFLPTNSFGFLFVGIALLSLLSNSKCPKNYSIAIVPIMILAVAEPYFGSVIFLSIMVVGEIMIVTVLSKLSLQNKNYFAFAFILVSFIASMSMGYLAAIEKSLSVVTFNWLEECINVVSQATLFVGCLSLKKIK